jgi:hypothetical protein
LRWISARRHAQDGAVEEDVFAARQFGVEARAYFQQRGDPAFDADGALGGFGDAAQDFEVVDLPAPLWPMMPTRSPCSTSKLTSFRAQNSSSSPC